MAKSQKPSNEPHELKPEMRDLILRFDAKDRREEAKKTNGETKQRRRRSEKTKPAA